MQKLMTSKNKLLLTRIKYYVNTKLTICGCFLVFLGIGFFSGDLRSLGFAVTATLIGITAAAGVLLLYASTHEINFTNLISFSLASDMVPVAMALYFVGGLRNTWLFFLMIFIFIVGYLYALRASLICATFSFVTIVILLILEYSDVIPQFGTYALGKDFTLTDFTHWKDYIIPLFLLYYISAFASGYLNTRMHRASFKLEESNRLLEKELEWHKSAKAELDKNAVELIRSNKELQNFAYIASHDLQEPLRKVRTFGDRLRSKYGEQLHEEGLDFLGRMQNSAARMQNMINGLLAFSQVTTRARAFETVDLYQTVKDVLSDLEIRIDQAKARIELSPLPSIQGDPIQMHQLYQNLISNALKFHREGIPPFIQISFKEENNFYHIYVTDNGIGFDNKYAERIFHLFERLYGKGEFEGTGMGLAICRKIAEHHGGHISAHSIVGQGTTFTVVLPVTQKTIS